MRFLLQALAHTLLIIIALFNLNSTALNAALEESESLREKVSVEHIRSHQKALQTIADNNRGTRVAGSSGYRDSVSYVKQRMLEAGYSVRLQDFPIAMTEDLSPPELKILSPTEQSFQALVDFASMSSAGKIEISAEIEAVDLLIPSPQPNSSTSGCEREDFAGFTRGNVALIQRGDCSFNVKARNAIAAGASGVVIFNEGNPERTAFLASRLEAIEIPVVGASFAVGNQLSNNILKGPTGIRVHMKIDISNEVHQVQNVIAESFGGDAERVVTVGAHLDSVFGGAGINDNGSGSSTILSIAQKYAELGLVPHNKLRFIWFGAEEFGLLGSEFYVDSLSTTEKGHILAMLNFDMLSSPNYARFVYDGDSSPLNPHGSAYIEKIFLEYFSAKGLVTHPTDFNGRSDYGPFIGAGIPAGGLFSGAEGIKSARLAQIYGGTAGAPFDPCYHRACDNFINTGETPASALALQSLSELSGAAAHAVLSLSNTADRIRLPQELITDLPKREFDYKGHMPIR